MVMEITIRSDLLEFLFKRKLKPTAIEGRLCWSSKHLDAVFKALTSPLLSNCRFDCWTLLQAPRHLDLVAGFACLVRANNLLVDGTLFFYKTRNPASQAEAPFITRLTSPGLHAETNIRVMSIPKRYCTCAKLTISFMIKMPAHFLLY